MLRWLDKNPGAELPGGAVDISRPDGCSALGALVQRVDDGHVRDGLVGIRSGTTARLDVLDELLDLQAVLVDWRERLDAVLPVD